MTTNETKQQNSPTTTQDATGGDCGASTCSPFFVFDVESVGLHGEAFAVAGGVYIDGIAQSEFRFSIPRDKAIGDESDREWVDKNVPPIPATHSYALAMRSAFWEQWKEAKGMGATMAAECLWPVEGRFVNACIEDQPENRKWDGPYPFCEISSVMMAAGMDPMATYEREESEKPAHEPLADARQSARLLATALRSLAYMSNAKRSNPSREASMAANSAMKSRTTSSLDGLGLGAPLCSQILLDVLARRAKVSPYENS